MVGEAGSGRQRLEGVAQSLPDVVVCDVSLGDGSGIDLVAAGSGAKIGLVVLTMHGDDDVLFAAIDAGASSLVLKGAHLDELVTAVRRAAVSPDVFSAAGLAEAMRRRARPRSAAHPARGEVLGLLGEGLSVHQVSSVCTCRSRR